MYAISKENELSLIIEHKIFYYFILTDHRVNIL
jgi:hypothetical protein